MLHMCVDVFLVPKYGYIKKKNPAKPKENKDMFLYNTYDFKDANANKY